VKIEQAIQTYVRSQRIRAVEEFIIESAAQGKIDNRDMYRTYCEDGKRISEAFGQKYLDMVGFEEHELGKEIQQVKQKYERAARFLINSGLPTDEVYLSLGLSLMTSDDQQFTQALNGFDLIQRISIDQDSSDLIQGFNRYQRSLGMETMKTIRATFTHAVIETQAQDNFGLRKSIQSGMSLPEALREATKNREQFLEMTNPIQRQIDAEELKEAEIVEKMFAKKEAEIQREVIDDEIASNAFVPTQQGEPQPNVTIEPKGRLQKIKDKLAELGRRL